jgi:hypothetical protein
MTMFAQPEQPTTWSPTPQTGLAGEISANVLGTIHRANDEAPRNLQVAIGPSEIGTPCVRQLAYKLLDWEPKPNSSINPWPAIIGTAVHAWLADVYEAENRRLGRERYLVERTLRMTPTLRGHSDLFDRDISTVIDWKIVGLDQVRKYRKNGPGPIYRTQGHTYGLGQQLAGERVEHVAVVFLPRGGNLRDMHVWTEPYDHRIALDAIKRIDSVRDLIVAADPETNPQNWRLFPTADDCVFCPHSLPGSTDLSVGCPGPQ